MTASSAAMPLIRSARPTRRMGLLAVLCAVLTALVLVAVPVYSVSTATDDGGGLRTSHHDESLLAHEGVVPFFIVTAVPLVLSGLVYWAAVRSRKVSGAFFAVLLWTWVVVTGLSFGLLYVPTALLVTATILLAGRGDRGHRIRT